LAHIARLGSVLFCLRTPIRSRHLSQDLGQPGTDFVRVAERSTMLVTGKAAEPCSRAPSRACSRGQTRRRW
jgi:hypothetical protein